MRLLKEQVRPITHFCGNVEGYQRICLYETSEAERKKEEFWDVFYVMEFTMLRQGTLEIVPVCSARLIGQNLADLGDYINGPLTDLNAIDLFKNRRFPDIQLMPLSFRDGNKTT
jgi:hypothetical protein